MYEKQRDPLGIPLFLFYGRYARSAQTNMRRLSISHQNRSFLYCSP